MLTIAKTHELVLWMRLLLLVLTIAAAARAAEELMLTSDTFDQIESSSDVYAIEYYSKMCGVSG